MRVVIVIQINNDMLVEELGVKLGKGEVVKVGYKFILSNGFWYRRTRDKFGNTLTYNSNGYWYKVTRDKFGNVLTYRTSTGSWYEYTRDSFGNQLTHKRGNTNTDKK
jgi:hypothetical protein